MNKASLGNTTVTATDVEEVVRRIVDVAHPDKIILFGSAARGEMGPHTDLDFLIIKGGAHRRELTDRIRLALRGVNSACTVDIVDTPASEPRTVVLLLFPYVGEPTANRRVFY